MKTRCRYSIIIVSAAVLACCIPRQGTADNAAVLPTGISQAYWDLYHYLPTRQRYNADGNREDLAYPFTDAVLDSSVLTSLAPLDPLVPGAANIGQVSVDYEYDIDVLDLGYSYGLTDKLSIGIHIPYYWIKNNVDTSLDTTNANVGLNPATGTCCIPLGAGGVPMDTDDVQNLVSDLYGFSKLDTWQRDGIGDTELGAKYQFYCATVRPLRSPADCAFLPATRTMPTSSTMSPGVTATTRYCCDCITITWSVIYGNR